MPNIIIVKSLFKNFSDLTNSFNSEYYLNRIINSKTDDSSMLTIEELQQLLQKEKNLK